MQNCQMETDSCLKNFTDKLEMQIFLKRYKKFSVENLHFCVEICEKNLQSVTELYA